MKYINQNIAYYLLVLGFAFSCGLKTSDKIDSDSVNKEIKERKIKRIHENDIVEKGFSIGNSIALSKKFGSECGLIDKTIYADSLQSFITKIWVECSTPSNEIEKSVWEAYQYNRKNNLELSSNIQKITTSADRKSYLYSSPFVINDSLKILQVELNNKALVLSLY